MVTLAVGADGTFTTVIVPEPEVLVHPSIVYTHEYTVVIDGDTEILCVV